MFDWLTEPIIPRWVFLILCINSMWAGFMLGDSRARYKAALRQGKDR